MNYGIKITKTKTNEIIVIGSTLHDELIKFPVVNELVFLVVDDVSVVIIKFVEFEEFNLSAVVVIKFLEVAGSVILLVIVGVEIEKLSVFVIFEIDLVSEIDGFVVEVYENASVILLVIVDAVVE